MDCKTTNDILETSNDILGGLILSPDTPPFIGLAEIDLELQDLVIKKSRAFLNGNTNNLYALFYYFPYVSAWCVTSKLSEDYGNTDQAIYKHLEEIFRVSLNRNLDRENLHAEFCLVCDKLGLPSRGFNRMVDVYLLHSGVPKSMVSTLIEAFKRQKTAFGHPPAESPELLNHWENDSLRFLPPAIKTIPRAIFWDETGWHAALFAKIDKQTEEFNPQHPFEEYFNNKFKEIGSPQDKHSDYIHIPKPLLFWDNDGLALKTPKVEGRIKVFLDHDPQPYSLRGGEEWILPQPWPQAIKWCHGEHEGNINFLPENSELTYFDYATGRSLSPRKVKKSEVFEIDTRHVVILSREKFSVDNNPAFEIGEVGFASINPLTTTVTIFRDNFDDFKLRSKPRRRLTVSQGQIANGPKGALFDSNAILNVETGLPTNESRLLRVSSNGESADISIKIIKGVGNVRLIDLFSNLPDTFPPDPLKMQVDLMTPGDEPMSSVPSGVKIHIWFWPAFSRINGNVYESVQGPKNLVLDQSQHITVDNMNCLTLDPNGGYVYARAIFEIEFEFIPFDFPWPDIVVTRRGLNGSEVELPFGTRLAVDQESRFDTLTIRCPDRHASLIVRGKKEPYPFLSGLPRNLAIRNLLEVGDDNRVILQRSNGNELFLFEIVPSIAPESVEYQPSYGGITILINLYNSIDALALEIQHENEGNCPEFVEVGFGRRPVSTRRPFWLQADLVDGNSKKIKLTVSEQGFNEGFVLIRIYLRPALDSQNKNSDSWHPLRNNLGDTFAFVLENSTPICNNSNLRKSFEKLNGWLAERYTDESWATIERPLIKRWEEVGLTLSSKPGGLGSLISLASWSPSEHEARNWIPEVHPIQFKPDLYNAPIINFAGLSGQQNSGLEEMAKLYSLVQSPLREQTQLHPTAYLAFRNSREAAYNGDRLEGFDPKTFFKNLPMVDNDPSAGWFWHGTPILGPDHWRASYTRFLERIDLVGFFANDDSFSNRQFRLHKLINTVWKITEQELRPPVPIRGHDQLGIWVATTLSEFARASRSNQVDAFLLTLNQHLDLSDKIVLSTLSLLLRLAPELFAFFLLTWQLAEDRP